VLAALALDCDTCVKSCPVGCTAPGVKCYEVHAPFCNDCTATCYGVHQVACVDAGT